MAIEIGFSHDEATGVTTLTAAVPNSDGLTDDDWEKFVVAGDAMKAKGFEVLRNHLSTVTSDLEALRERVEALESGA